MSKESAPFVFDECISGHGGPLVVVINSKPLCKCAPPVIRSRSYCATDTSQIPPNAKLVVRRDCMAAGAYCRKCGESAMVQMEPWEVTQ